MNVPTKPTTSVSLPATSLLMDPSSFEHLYRVGKMLAMSSLFPDHLRKGTIEQAAANGALVMNMAMRLNEDPLTVAQSIYFVGGKPGWSASYMISKANQHSVFKDPIDWTVKGDGEDLSVTAFAELSATGKKVAVTCDMNMAKAEGWTKNAKYKSMPEQMLRYRSATFLIRLYCPEVMIGIPSQVEIEFDTMRDVTPHDFTPVSEERDRDPGDITPKPKTEEKPKPEPEATSDSKPEPEKAKEPDHDAETGEVLDAPPSEEGKVQEVLAKHGHLMDTIIADLTDASNSKEVDEIADLYGPQLTTMKAEAPDIYDRLLKEITAFRASHGDEG